jgi:hypothetical protein
MQVASDVSKNGQEVPLARPVAPTNRSQLRIDKWPFDWWKGPPHLPYQAPAQERRAVPRLPVRRRACSLTDS